MQDRRLCVLNAGSSSLKFAVYDVTGGAPKRVVEALTLTPQEAFGRNAWMIWCAGNEGFWDWLANNSFGSTDFTP